MNRRRSNIEIIADMLRVGENGAGKTEIMYSEGGKSLSYLSGNGQRGRAAQKYKLHN